MGCRTAYLLRVVLSFRRLLFSIFSCEHEGILGRGKPPECSPGVSESRKFSATRSKRLFVTVQRHLSLSVCVTLWLGAHWQLNSCGDISIMSMIPNNMNKKINIFFSNFCSAGSLLQFVTIDLQTSHHNLPFRFLSLYCLNFIIQSWSSLHLAY